MRSLTVIAVAIAAAVLSACASSSAPTEKSAAPAVPVAKKAPQCWSGDAGKFFNVGEKQSIAGVAVECKPSSDGKAASWVGGKH